MTVTAWVAVAVFLSAYALIATEKIYLAERCRAEAEVRTAEPTVTPS
ncbi:hypothetical protein [Nonomuraea sp. 10N515B]